MSTLLEFTVTLLRAVKAYQLYAPGHPRHEQFLASLETTYHHFLEGRSQVQIGALNNRLFLDQQMEDLDKLSLRTLATLLEEHGIRILILYPGVTTVELGHFLSMMNLKPGMLMAAGGAKRQLEEMQVVHIRIVPTRVEDLSDNAEMLKSFLEATSRGGAGAGPGPGGSGPGGDGPGGGGPGRNGPGGNGPGGNVPGGNGPGGNGPGGNGPGGDGPGGGGPGRGGPGGNGPGGNGPGGNGPGGNGPVGGGPGRGGPGGSGPGGGDPGGSGPSGGPGAPGGGSGRDPGSVVENLQAFLSSLAGNGVEPSDVSGLAAYLEGLGLDRQGSTPNTQGMITRAVTMLEPGKRLNVLMGSAELRSGPLRGLFSRLAGTMAAPSLASAFACGDRKAEEVAEASLQLKKILPANLDWVGQVSEALRRGGMSNDQLKDLVDILGWESRPAEERIQELLKGERIFEMPVEKVLAFLRELLEAGQIQEFSRLVRHFATGLAVPAVARRVAVAQAFATIADWVRIPGMPAPIMDQLMEMLSYAYCRERNPEVLPGLSEAVEHILWFLMDSGQAKEAAARFAVLQDLEEEQGPHTAWKESATRNLLLRLGSLERMGQLLAKLFQLDRPAAAEQVHPAFAMLGPSAADHLVELLTQERDRVRRGRIIEALRSCGSVAEGPLLEALKSSEWFVVRNALLLLAEVAGPERVPQLEPFLDNPDSRVRLTAVRAMGRIGGRAAESALIRLVGSTDHELQMEVLYLLDELKVRRAVPAILELLKVGKGRNRSGSDKVREKALEVLGHLGSGSIIPDLAGVLSRHKGFFRDAREPLPARIGALRALQALGVPESHEAIRKALALEPPGQELDALQAALREATAAVKTPS